MEEWREYSGLFCVIK